MQKLTIILSFICCCLFSLSAFGQKVVSGTIYNENNERIPGALVVLKSSKSISTTSDIEGNYSLKIPQEIKEYTLDVSLIGFIPQTKKLNASGTQTVDFYLKEKSVDLDMVVVTATRTPKLLKNSPIITKVITESDIKKMDATNIEDLLKAEIPGIEFTYSMNQQTAINMQGFGGNAVLFLVDGERIAGETLDNIDYSRLNLDNVERIEIIKGAASTLYGSSALGGVINIITKKPTQDWAVNLNTRFGTYNDQRYGGSIALRKGKFSSMTNIQHTSHDQYTMIGKETYPNSKGKMVRDTATQYAGTTWNIKEKLDYTVNEKLKISGRAGYYIRDRESQPQNSIRDRYRDFSGGLSGNYLINDKNDLELAYSYDQFDKGTYNSKTKLDVRNYSNVQNIARGSFNHTFNQDMALTFGGDFMRDYLSSYQFKDSTDYHQYVADAYAQFDWTIIDNLNMISGLRYDYFSDDNISRVTPKLGLMYRVDNCALRASYASGFRAPTLKEMYMNFDMASIFMIYGNPDLKSETSHNFTLSTEYTNNYYNLSVTGYYNKVKNKITAAWDQTLNGQLYTNIRNINITGVDVNASAKYPCGIGARLSYTYVHDKIKKGEPLNTSTRPHSATARIEYGKNWKNYGFNIMLNGRFLSKLNTEEPISYTDYSKTVSVSYPAYTMWKLSLLQSIYKGIDLTMAVDNLFNYHPGRYNSNTPYTKGATFTIGVSLSIDQLVRK